MCYKQTNFLLYSCIQPNCEFKTGVPSLGIPSENRKSDTLVYKIQLSGAQKTVKEVVSFEMDFSM